MKVRAKVKGILNRPIRWVHEAGEEKEIPDKLAERILTNGNYENVSGGAKKPKDEETKEPEETEKTEEPKIKKKKKGSDY